MKKLMRSIHKEKGFTLLEVIVTITVAAVMFSVLIAFMGTAITKSSDPVKQVRDLGTSSGKIETISSAYACYLKECTDNSTCCNNCICTWPLFKSACNNYGTVYTVPSGSDIYSENFETIKVVTKTNDQTIVTYFME